MKLDPDAYRRDTILRKLLITEAVTKNRMERIFNEPLSAQEVLDGVRLTRDDFIYIARAAIKQLRREDGLRELQRFGQELDNAE